MVGAEIADIQSNHIISTIKHFVLNDQETDPQVTGDSVIDPAAARTSDLLALQFVGVRKSMATDRCSAAPA